MKSLRVTRARFDVENRLAAEDILDSLEAHGGEGSALVQWARTICSGRTVDAVVPVVEPQGELFPEEGKNR